MYRNDETKLRLSKIVKKYGEKTVLKSLSLEVKSGEKLSILGPSGCGKSTLLNIMAGLIDEFDGNIFLNQEDITTKPANKRNIVIVSQDNFLFPHMNVYENIAFPMRVRKFEEVEIKVRVIELLNEIGLNGYENKKVNKLSGGEKQRIALARALAAEPEILLLDEAYSSLDTNLRHKMRELTISLHNKHNITTILVTHDKEEAMMFSDRICVILQGEVKQIDEPQTVYNIPSCIEVAKFLMSDNYVGLKEAIEIGVIDSKDISDFKEESLFLIKPEDIELGYYRDGVKAKVIDKKYSIGKIKYQVEIKGFRLIVDDYRRNEFEVGDEVSIRIKHYVVY